MSYDEHRATPSAPYPTPAPPGAAPIGCLGFLFGFALLVGVVGSLIMFYRDGDPAWLAVSLLCLGFRKWSL